MDWQRYVEAAAATQCDVIHDSDLRRYLFQVWSFSDFAANTCVQNPEMLLELVNSGDLHYHYRGDEYVARFTSQLDETHEEDDLMQLLRHVRQREMLRIAFRDLAGWADLNETMRDVSALADACIQISLHLLEGWMRQEYGRPCNPAGRTQSMLVLGMGKLGARELNFSSDIDLIFAYPESGRTRGGILKIDNEEYFEQLAQRLIYVLNTHTADGYVFRVDMRLRPFGDSGALVQNFDALEHYYQAHGREWERYAFIKARIITGSAGDRAELTRIIRPFVFRRYIDYSAIDSMRKMKTLIDREVRRKSMQNNVKLGRGGIREIEFIGQVFQLLRGGREQRLQQRPIQTILDLLQVYEFLKAVEVLQLQQAYVFLRNVEHRLQMFRDEQTHDLPNTEPEKMRLAMSMGFANWPDFEKQLATHRDNVHGVFSGLFAEHDHDAEAEQDDFGILWMDAIDEEAAAQCLEGHGFSEAEHVIEHLRQFRASYTYRALSAEGKSRLDQLMPVMLAAMTKSTAPTQTFYRVIAIIERIAQRSVYLVLLLEYPQALEQLVILCSASPWIADQLAMHPILLDGLLDTRHLYEPLSKPELQAEMARLFADVDEHDLEQQMNILREFKNAHVLRVAAADVSQQTPVMIVSDHLTDIAEVILQQVLDIAWHYMVRQHGRPSQLADGIPALGFGIIGYGKLGSIELGYGSDLDIVFIYGGDEEGQTDGKRPLENQVFYARLAQRIISLLNTQTHEGVLYEVDIRLRPSGASGLLVSSINAFREYQLDTAWTWEHQALVRARVVAGPPMLAEAFDVIRRAVLSTPRDPEKLRVDVTDMRRRMRKELCKQKPGKFDLKQAAGGIADIEFMVQYSVLRWAPAHMQLLHWTDDIRLLETLAQLGLWSGSDVDGVSAAYKAYRNMAHHLTLQDEPILADESDFVKERELVKQVWHRLFAESL